MNRGSGRVLSGTGVGGQLSVDDDWVVIDRKGVLAKARHGLAGTKRIPISVISAVQVKQATSITRGYIQFSLPGGNESRGGLRDAHTDENTVVFNKSHAGEFEAIRVFVEGKIAENRSAPRDAVAAGPSLADELRKLGDLRDSGLLSEAEFAAQKAKLLA